MKRKLLYTLAGLLLTSAVMEAQEFISEDFNSYTEGYLSTDLQGMDGGQGNWKVFAAVDARLEDFQIRPWDGNGKVLVVNSPNTPSTNANDNVKYVWKDLPTNGWDQRTAGNDIFKVEYEFYTGDLTPTSAAHRNITIARDGTFIAGFQYEPALGRLRGMTRLNIDGMPKLQFITLRGPQADLILPANTWVKVCYQVNFLTDAVTFQIPSANINGDIPTVSLRNQQPWEINFASYLSEWDVNESAIMYDNYKVSAVRSQLSVNHTTATNFVLYPNPVTDVVTISNKENITMEQISVFDTNGRLVYGQKCNKESEVSINLAGLTTGLYIVHITTNEGTIVKKLIKQ